MSDRKKEKNSAIESPEAEQAVLGSILIRPEKIHEVMEKISADDFCRPTHRDIFAIMALLATEDIPADLVMVSKKLKEERLLEKIGGPSYLASLSEQVGFSTNLPHYVQVIHDKSTLRRLQTAAKTIYHSCNNGSKPDEVLGKALELFKSISEGTGVKRQIGITGLVKEWVLAAPGVFNLSDVYRDLNVEGKNRKSISKALERFVKEELIERMPGKRGFYRRVEAETDAIDFLSADPGGFLDIFFPMDLQTYVRIFPTNLIIVAGEKGAGKTAFCLDTVRLNMDRWPVRYLSSEMEAQELRVRLESFNIPLEHWQEAKFFSRKSDFADVIDPDAINIVDFLEKYEDFYTIGRDIRAIFDKLQKGICIVAVQKDEKSPNPRGGTFTREKSRMTLTLTRENEARLDDVKTFGMPGYNPNGLIFKYKLIAGARFKLVEMRTK